LLLERRKKTMRSISCDLTKTNQKNNGIIYGCQGNRTLYLVINIYVCLIPSKSANNWLKQYITSLTSITKQEGLTIFFFLKKNVWVIGQYWTNHFNVAETISTTIPKWYEPNQTCEYYDGLMRCNIENYHSFKDKLF